MLTRRPTARRTVRTGFTLVELMIVLVVFGLVAGAILGVIVRQQRFYAGAAEITGIRGNMRELATILPADLRGLSSVGGDIYSMSDSSIDFRLPVGSAVICQILGGGLSVIVAPVSLTSRSGVTVWLSTPVSGDSVFIYDEGTSSAVADDSWRKYTLTTAPTGAGVCPITTGFTALGSEQAAGMTMMISPALPATTPQGSMMRFFRRAHYSFYATSGGSYLGFYDCPGGVCNTMSRMSGPFMPYAAGSGGLQFSYSDSTGAVTAIPAQVARIDVVVRAQTRGPIALAGGKKEYYRDSLAFMTALRNRK